MAQLAVAEKVDSTANIDSSFSVDGDDAKAWWKPVVKELQAFGGNNDIANHSLFYIFIIGFVGGLLALVMPCIWPIIPMTVSFFLKRAKNDKKKGIRDAITYGLSIVIIYLALGLTVTAIAGPSTLNALSTSAVFNIILFLLLAVFAFSFFGWFEIKLPDSWGNAVDNKASSTTGTDQHLPDGVHTRARKFLLYRSYHRIAFGTDCYIGRLVGSNHRYVWFCPCSWPCHLPSLHSFPSWLKSAPKSGSWMETIKIVLGFIELAFSLKFLSVADLAYGWHIMDREVFLSLWIVIFGLLGSLPHRQVEVPGRCHRRRPQQANASSLASCLVSVLWLSLFI